MLLRVALYGGFLFGGVPLAFSYVMTKTHPPADLSRPPREYEELALISDGLRLRAWLSKGAPERPAFVIVHGLGDSLESYLDHARPIRQRGSTVLLVDLRGHGGSQGTLTTLGGKALGHEAAPRPPEGAAEASFLAGIGTI